MKNILSEYWNDLYSRNNQTSKKMLDCLDSDILSSIIIDGHKYWIEKTFTDAYIPNYLFIDIKRYMKRKQNATYLFD